MLRRMKTLGPVFSFNNFFLQKNNMKKTNCLQKVTKLFSKKTPIERKKLMGQLGLTHK